MEWEKWERKILEMKRKPAQHVPAGTAAGQAALQDGRTCFHTLVGSPALPAGWGTWCSHRVQCASNRSLQMNAQLTAKYTTAMSCLLRTERLVFQNYKMLLIELFKN